MTIVMVKETAGVQRLEVLGYAEDALAWQETIEEAALALWLKTAEDEGRIGRSDVILRVLPETRVARRLIEMPKEISAAARRGMAASALAPFLGERPRALVLRATAAENLWALSGTKETVREAALKPFGRYKRRVRLVAEADVALCSLPPLDDGYYLLQTLFWSAAVAVQDGVIIDGRSTNGTNGFALYEAMRAEHEKLPGMTLSEGARPLALGEEQTLASARLFTLAWPAATNFSRPERLDKPMLALLVGCVLLPGLLLLGLALSPDSETTSAPTENSAPVVAQSDYSTLVSQATARKSERITLLSFEAEGGALSLEGRCPEALDLADYMRQLASGDPPLHPLLVDMVREEEEDAYHYSFVVQIQLEGRNG